MKEACNDDSKLKIMTSGRNPHLGRSQPTIWDRTSYTQSMMVTRRLKRQKAQEQRETIAAAQS